MVQCNLNHCQIAQDLLMQYERKKKIGISVIAEPYRIPEDPTWVSSMDNWSAIHCNYDHARGLGVIIRRGQRSVAVKWSDGNFCVIACYVSPNSDDDKFVEFLDELEEMTREAGSNVVIGGDFNSRSKLGIGQHQS